MKRRILIAVLFFSIMWLPVTSQTATKIVIGQQPVYNIHRAKEAMVIDGKMDEAAWRNAEVRTFDNFFRLRGSLDKQNTKFRILYDD